MRELEFVDVRKTYQSPTGQDLLALADFSLKIDGGRFVSVVGPSGCGKTTLMRAIVGVQLVHGGSIDVLGHPAGSRPLRRLIGYSTQEPAVYADLTVAENLRYFGRVLNAPRSDIGRVLGELGLDDVRDQIAGRLSGGQLHRASLAVALLGSPELLVLDEPTVGLDPVLRRDLWDLFHRLAAGGLTLVVSSHVMDEAARCDRLILMRDGEILADDTPAGLRATTGTSELDDAFLRLIDARDGAVA